MDITSIFPKLTAIFLLFCLFATIGNHAEQLCLHLPKRGEKFSIGNEYKIILLLPQMDLFCCTSTKHDRLNCEWFLQHKEKQIPIILDNEEDLHHHEVRMAMEQAHIPTGTVIEVIALFTEPKKGKTSQKFLVVMDYGVSLTLNGEEADDVHIKFCSYLDCQTSDRPTIGKRKSEIVFGDLILTPPITYSEIEGKLPEKKRYEYFQVYCRATWTLPRDIFSYENLVRISKVINLHLKNDTIDISLFRRGADDTILCRVQPNENSEILEHRASLKVWSKKSEQRLSGSKNLEGRKIELKVTLSNKYLDKRIVAQCCAAAKCNIKNTKSITSRCTAEVVFRKPSTCNKRTGNIYLSPKRNFYPKDVVICKFTGCEDVAYHLKLEHAEGPSMGIKILERRIPTIWIPPDYPGGLYNITCIVTRAKGRLHLFTFGTFIGSKTWQRKVFIPVHSVTIDRNRVSIFEGDEIICQAKGYPQPTVNWLSVTLRGEEMTSSAKFGLNFFVNGSMLKVRQGAIIGPTLVECYAANKFDELEGMRRRRRRILEREQREQFRFYIERKEEDQYGIWYICVYIIIILLIYYCIYASHVRSKRRRNSSKRR